MRDDSRDCDHDLLFEIPTVKETANFVQSLVDNVHANSHNNEYTKEEWLEVRNQFTLKHGTSPFVKYGDGRKYSAF
jgi:hypothetical protein